MHVLVDVSSHIYTHMYICTYSNEKWYRRSRQGCLLVTTRERESERSIPLLAAVWICERPLIKWAHKDSSREPLLYHWYSRGWKGWTDNCWPERAASWDICCKQSTVQWKNGSKGAEWLRVDLLYCKILPDHSRCQQGQESCMVSKMLRWQREVS